MVGTPTSENGNENERRNSLSPVVVGKKRKRCSFLSDPSSANDSKRQCFTQKGTEDDGRRNQNQFEEREEDLKIPAMQNSNNEGLSSSAQQVRQQRQQLDYINVPPKGNSTKPVEVATVGKVPSIPSSFSSESKKPTAANIPVPAASVLRNLGNADRQKVSNEHVVNNSSPKQNPSPENNIPDTASNNSSVTNINATSAKIRSTLQNNTEMDRIIDEVDRRYYQVALFGFLTWLALTLISFYIASITNRLELLSGLEEKAPLIASMLLGMSLFSSTMPLFVKKMGGNYGQGKKSLLSTEMSGIMACSIVVHFVAFVTDLLMAKFPTPVFLDPISGTRMYLLRWCEWTPLAFIMTFVTEACRPKDDEDEEEELQNESGDRDEEISPLKRIFSMWRRYPQRSHEEEHVDGDRGYVSETENDSEESDSALGVATGGEGHDYEDISHDGDGDGDDAENEETIRVNIGKNLRPAYILAATQGLSTLCGWFFPFCPNFISWAFLMSLSFVFYAMIFVRCHYRSKSFETMKPGATIAQQEFYHWAELSLRLLRTCRAMWSVLVVSYFIYTMGPLFFPNNPFLNLTGLAMVCESVIDVLFKSVYMMVIVDVHHSIFDQNTRVERRLEEMRKMMGVVWDNSSDIICISVRNMNGNVTTMLSPTFAKICSSMEVYERGGDCQGHGHGGNHISGITGAGNSAAAQKNTAIAFELDSKLFEREQRRQPMYSPQISSSVSTSIPDEFDNLEPKILYNVHFNDLMNPCARSGSPAKMNKWDRKKSTVTTEHGDSIDEMIASMARLVVRAWNTDNDVNMIMHELFRRKRGSGNDSDDAEQHRDQVGIRMEANLTRMEDNAMLIVVRDISERMKRFEAEKKVISETTARRKDAAANRFTRHEVKNGLLAAIGLCDSLREAEDKDKTGSRSELTRSHASLGCIVEELKRHQLYRNNNANSPSASSPNWTSSSSNTKRYLFELDKTLHEILDTVLAEAMARDVIHEVYEPKLERVDVVKLLYSTISVPASSVSGGSSINANNGVKNNKRFPITTVPSSLPEYALDPQLLKCIHRNAISNACKYGKRGGVIRTDVFWDRNTRTLRMNVINLPGPRHKEILRLGPLASEIVFSPRKRLTVHSTMDCDEQTPTHSSGDGAWIMNKCAKTLGGECTIKFEPDNTVFTFRCPVMPYNEMLATANISHEGFEMPKNVWGIALDDSKIQRKLLVRFFMYVGIPEDHICIFGSNGDEIKGFDSWAVRFINAHPNDYFLMIIDENLDVQGEDATSQVTISGSLAISEMRSRLVIEQERRVLSLIRSANDSASDVAIYQARAHGFLPKAPIKKESVREVLVPMWLKRFPRFDIDAKKHEIGGKEKKMSIEDIESEDVVMEDLIPCIDDLDNFASLHSDDLNDKWNIIWEKLHALKGDLLIIPNHADLIEAIRLISTLRGPTPPENLHEKWQSIKSALQSYQTATL